MIRMRPSSQHPIRPVLILLLAAALFLAACAEAADVAEPAPDEPVDDAVDDDVAEDAPEPEEPAEVPAEADFPVSTIEFVVPWAAGGGTDRMARMLAPFIGDELGVRINVINRVGGAGVVGHTDMATGSPDGSVLGLATTELTMNHHLGLTDLTYHDIEPVATLGANWSSVIVRADSPFETIEDLLAHVEENPGELIGSGTSTGGIWHVGMIGMLLEAGLPSDAIRWVPSEGGAPALQELLAGGIDISFASLPENVAQIEEGGVRPLAIMADDRDSNFPDVPTLREQGIEWTLTAPFFLVAPGGTPDDLLTTLEAAMERISDNPEFRELMATNMFGSVWWDREETEARFEWADDVMGQMLREAGMTE